MGRKANAPLLIGIGLPIVALLVVAALVYVPRWRAPVPAYDMLIAVNNGAKTRYSIADGKLSQSEGSSEHYYGTATLYRYRVPDGGASPLSFADASALNLDFSTISPDKYEFQPRSWSFDLFFFGGDEGPLLAGHGTRWKLVGVPDGDVELLGWIVE